MAENLKFYADGRELDYFDRIRQEGAKFYKDIGSVTWRVPPVKFNVMKMVGPDACRVISTPQQTDQETNCAENIVCGTFENLSRYLVKKEPQSALFIVSNFEYDNYLNKIYSLKLDGTEALKLPKDVASRGELDILILQQKAGILLVQTKAVGYNIPCSVNSIDQPDGSEGASAGGESNYVGNIHRAVEKAVEQLSRDCKVILYVMGDLGIREFQLTKLVALPKLRRQFLHQALNRCDQLRDLLMEHSLQPDLHFLCKEDFACDDKAHQKNLENWWQDKLLPLKKGISLEAMKEIAYRTVGLMSTVSVWSSSQPRMEVRNLNDAAWETGNRFTQVLLSSQQAAVLQKEDKYFYVWGPAGSGKTLLLSLKGHLWLKKYSVAILNTRLGSKGRTVGHVMESTINKAVENSNPNKKCKLNKVKRIDIDLAEDEKNIQEEVLKKVRETVNADAPKNSSKLQTMFLIDEVTWVPETVRLIKILQSNFPQSSIWCAGMLEECKPEGFNSEELLSILRCPPSVQRVLRIVDNRQERRKLYHLDSSRAGLPTDGPRPHFIIHSTHGPPSVQPYDCVKCAKKMSKFLLNTLNLKTTLDSGDQDGSHEEGARPRIEQGCRLHFNDAVLAVSMPQSWHHHTVRGYWAISKEALHSNMMFLGSSPFCQRLLDEQIPLKVEGAMTFTPDKNVEGQTFAMCPIGSVHGLEYKVVVCIPSARDLPEFTEINEGIIYGQRGPRVPMRRLPLALDIKKKKEASLMLGPGFCTCFLQPRTADKNKNFIGHSQQIVQNGSRDEFRTMQENSVANPNEPKSDKIRISTHVHGDYLNKDPSKPLDLLYVKCEHPSASDVELDTTHSALNAEQHTPSSAPPALERQGFDHSLCLGKLKADVCGGCDTENCVCVYFTPEEIVALHKLDKWDKAYVLMCASRCTSQLILVLP